MRKCHVLRVFASLLSICAATPGEVARLVLSGFDNATGALPTLDGPLASWACGGTSSQYWCHQGTATSSLVPEFTTSDFAEGHGSLRLAYSIVNSESWGGFASLSHTLSHSMASYNLAGCSELSFQYKVEMPASSPGVEFRIILRDNGGCLSNCPAAPLANNVGAPSGFLGECQGYCTADDDCQGNLTCFVASQTGDGVPGCSGVPEEGKGYCRLPLDVSAPSEAGDEYYYSFHKILTEETSTWKKVAMKLEGSADTGSPFWQTGWLGVFANSELDLSAIRGYTMEVSLFDPNAVEKGDIVSGVLLVDELQCTGPAPLSAVFGGLSFARGVMAGHWRQESSPDSSQAVAFDKNEVAGSIVRASVEGGSLLLEHRLPHMAFYNLSGADLVSAWFMHQGDSNDTSCVLHLTGSQGNPGTTEQKALGDSVSAQASGNWTKHDFHQPPGVIYGFRLEVDVSSTSSTATCSLGGLHTTGILEDIAVAGDLQPLDVVFEDDLALNLWWVHDSRQQHPLVRTKEECGELCVNDPDCIYFSFVLPVSHQNCVTTRSVPKSLIALSAILDRPSNLRQDTIFRQDYDTFISGWSILGQPPACGPNASCSCFASDEESWDVICNSTTLSIFPDLAGLQLESLSLVNSSVPFITKSLLGNVTSIQKLILGDSIAYLDPIVVDMVSEIEVQGSAGLGNFITRQAPQEEQLYSDVCCSPGAEVKAGALGLLPCTFSHYQIGIDCIVQNWTQYDEGSTLTIASYWQEDERFGWSAKSQGDCCDLCNVMGDCVSWTYSQLKDALPRCRLLGNTGKTVISSLETSPGSGVPGYVSGDIPRYRSLQNYSLTASPQNVVVRVGSNFTYTLTLEGEIRRGAVWVKPIASSASFVVKPEEVAFYPGFAKTVSFTVHANARPDSHNVVLQHRVSGCDAVWVEISQSASSSIEILPLCPEGEEHRKDANTGSLLCKSCRPGYFKLDVSDNPCELCGEDTFKALAGSGSCSACPLRWGLVPMKPSTQRSTCVPDGTVISICAVCCLLLVILFVSARSFRVEPIALEDITEVHGQVILTTAREHQLNPPSDFSDSQRVMKLMLRNTSIPTVDGGEFLATAKNNCQLVLLQMNGEPVAANGMHETSKGQALPFCSWRFFLNRKAAQALFCALSVLVLVLAFEIAANTLLAVAGIAFLFASAVIMLLSRWQATYRKTSLDKLLKTHSRHLEVQNPRPAACEKGPGRAISFHQLKQLSRDFREVLERNPKNRTMHYICSNIVLPLTQTKKLSYAELSGPKEVCWFVSHFWGTAFLDFVSTIAAHDEALTHKSAEISRSISTLSAVHADNYWICTFSNNQWDLANELGHGSWEFSSFYVTLRSQTVRGTVMVLDRNVTPLRRSWCLFELLQTFQLSGGNEGDSLGQDQKKFFGLFMSTSSGVLNFGNCGIDTAISVGESLAHLRLADATASDPKDKAMIDGLIQQQEGGFEHVDSFVKEKINAVLEELEHNVTQSMRALRGELLHSSKSTLGDVDESGEHITELSL